MRQTGKVFINPLCNAGDAFNNDLLSFMNAPVTPTSNPAEADLLMLGGILTSLQNPKYAVNTTPLYIWGTGFLLGDDVHGPLCRPNLVVRALRGRLSKEKLSGLMGVSYPEDLPLADPGLLASYFAGPDVEKRYSVGFIPHFREHGSCEVKHVLETNQNLHFIDITRTPVEVIREIRQCDAILSSSLHGLIFSDSLGIPNCHVRLTEKPLGGSFKFRDYYSSFGLSDPALTMEDALKITRKEIIDNYAVDKDAVEEKKVQLIESFPDEFRHYTSESKGGKMEKTAVSVIVPVFNSQDTLKDLNRKSKWSEAMDSGNNVKVSVIIPIYNQEKYLLTCLESVLLQDLREIEVICVNDGSTDGSFDILSDLSWSDERVIVINQENMGVGEARNRGLLEAKGEYIAFMDPDDWYYDSKALETLYNRAKENSALICGGCFTIQHEKRGEKDHFSGNEARYTFREDRMYSYREYQYDYGFHRFIYDRKMIVENRLFFPKLKRFQDPVWFVKAMHIAGSFFGVSDRIYAFRSGHKVNAFDKEKVSHIIQGITETARFARENEYDHLLNLERLRLIRGTADDIWPYIREDDEEIMELLRLFEEASGFQNTEKDILINIIQKREMQLEKTMERLKEQEQRTGHLRMENGSYKRLIDSQRSELEQISENLEALFEEMGGRLKQREKRSVNILPFPYPAMEQDMDGIKWKVMEDGSIEANGKAEADTQFTLTKPLAITDFKTAHGRYRVSTGASDTSCFTWYISGLICNREDGSKCVLRDAVINRTNGFAQSFEIDTSGYEYFGRLFLAVKGGRTLDHVIFRPEICPID